MPPVVAVVASLVVSYVGVSAWVAFALNLLINAAASSYARHHQPKYPDPADNRKHVSRTSDSPLIVLYGKRRISGPLIYWHTGTNGSNTESLSLCIAFAEHEFEEYNSIYFGERECTISGGTITYHPDMPTADFATLYKGVSGQTADNTLLTSSGNTLWTSNHKGEGMAYVVVYLNSYNDWDSIPTISVVASGSKIYDPRKDGSRLGSGTHDYDDPSTWEYSNNPALIARDYLTRAEGFDEDHAKIDDAWTISSANACDVQVDTPGANFPAGPHIQQNMYSCDIALSTTNSRQENLLQILDTLKGEVVYVGGQWKIMAGEYNVPTVTIGEDDIVGDISISQSTPASSAYNYVTGTYYDSARFYQGVNFTPQSSATYETRDGDRRIPKDIRLVGVTNEFQAQRLAQLELNFSEHQTSVKMTVIPRGDLLDLHVSSMIMLTLNNPAWTSKTFRVYSWELNEDLTVTLLLRDENVGAWSVPITIYLNNLLEPSYNPYNQLVVQSPTSVTFDTGQSTQKLLQGGAIQPVGRLEWVKSVNEMLQGYRTRWRPASAAGALSEGILETLPAYYFKGDEITGLPAINDALTPILGNYGITAATAGMSVTGLNPYEAGTAINVAADTARMVTIDPHIKLDVTRDFSALVIFKTNAAVAGVTILGQWGTTSSEQSFKLGTLAGSLNIGVTVRDDALVTYDIDSGSSYDDSQSHMAIVTLTTNVLSLDIDGVEVGTLDLTNKVLLLSKDYNHLIGGGNSTGSGSAVAAPIDYDAYWQANVGVAPTDFVAEWSLESDGSDTTTNHDATLFNTPTFAAGFDGNAMTLNGTTQYASMVDAAGLKPTSITVCGWVKAADVSNTPVLIQAHSEATNYAGWLVWIGPDGTIGAAVGSNTGSTADVDFKSVGLHAGVDFNLNEWIHFAFTYDGAVLRGFSNGALSLQKNFTGGLAYDTTTYMRIGCFNNSGTNAQFLDGSLDGLKVFDYVVSDEEIAALSKMFPDQQRKTRHAGLLLGSPTFSAGKIGNAITLNGVDQYVTLASNSDFNASSVTIAYWIRTSTSAQGAIFSNFDAVGALDSGYYSFMTSAGYSRFLVSDRTGNVLGSNFEVATSSTLINDGTWHHITVSYDGTNIKSYVDGILEGTTVWTNGIVYNGTEEIHIGVREWVTTKDSYLDADLDDIKYFPRALTDAEISALAGVTSSATSPVDYIAYWTMDNAQVSGSTLLDLSGNSHTATMVNTPTTGVTGQKAEAVTFVDTSDEHATIVNHSNFQQSNFSVSFWMKQATVNNGVIFQSGANASGSNWGFWASSTGTGKVNITLYLGTGWVAGTDYESAASTSLVVDNTWHHVVLTYGGSNLRVYVDGVLETTVAWTAGVAYHGTNTVLMAANVADGITYDTYYDGSVDDLKVYTRAISAAEVQAMFVADGGSLSSSPTDYAAYWTMDNSEVSGSTLLDLSGNSHTATMVNTPTTGVTGQKAEAVAFDVSFTEYATLVNHADLKPTVLTLSAWVNVLNNATAVEIFANYERLSGGTIHTGFNVRIGTTGYLTFTIGKNTGNTVGVDYQNCVGTTIIDDGNWHHTVATYDGTSLKVYVDGVLETTTTLSAGLVYSGTVALIGARQAISVISETMDGSLDDIKLYTRALSISEIQVMFSEDGGSLQTYNPPTDYNAYWTMDDAQVSGSTLLDLSGNSHTATMVNTPTTGVTGQKAEAVTWDGVDQHATIVGHANFNVTRLSISGWIKTTASVGGYILANFTSNAGDTLHSGFLLNTSAAGKISLEIWDNTGTVSGTNGKNVASTTVINDGSWHNFSMVYDGTELLAYIDGILENTRAWTTDPVYVSTDVRVGCRYSSGVNNTFLDGSIDDIKFYPRAITATEVQDIFLSDGGVLPTSVPTDYNLYLTMDDSEVSGSTLLDLSGNSHTATMVNTPTTGVTGQIGEAITWDGVNQYATLINHADLKPTSITISAWVRTTNTTDIMAIFSNQWRELVPPWTNVNGYRLIVDGTTGKAGISIGANTGLVDVTDFVTIGGGLVNDGAWHYVACTYEDGTEARIYVDGILEASETSTLSITYHTNTQVNVGVLYEDGLTKYFDGEIDDLKMYPRAITPAEMYAIYTANAGSGAVAGSLGYDGVWDDAAFWTKSLLPYERRNLWQLYNTGNVAIGLSTEWRNFSIGPNEILWDVDLEDQRYYDFSIEARNYRGILSTPVELLSRQVLANDLGPDQLGSITGVPISGGFSCTVDSSSVYNTDISQIVWTLSDTNNRLDGSATTVVGAVPSPRIGAQYNVSSITTDLLFTGTKYVWVRLVNTAGLGGSWNSGDTAGTPFSSGSGSGTGTITGTNFLPVGVQGPLAVGNNFNYDTWPGNWYIDRGWIGMSTVGVSVGDYISGALDIRDNVTATTASVYIEFQDNTPATIVTNFRADITLTATSTRYKLEAILVPAGAVQFRMRITIAPIGSATVLIDNSVLNQGLLAISSGVPQSTAVIDPNSTSSLSTTNSNLNLLDGDTNTLQSNTATVGTEAGGGPGNTLGGGSGGGYYNLN